jgi:hypothetical protein
MAMLVITRWKSQLWVYNPYDLVRIFKPFPAGNLALALACGQEPSSYCTKTRFTFSKRTCSEWGTVETGGKSRNYIENIQTLQFESGK